MDQGVVLNDIEAYNEFDRLKKGYNPEWFDIIFSTKETIDKKIENLKNYLFLAKGKIKIYELLGLPVVLTVDESGKPIKNEAAYATFEGTRKQLMPISKLIPTDSDVENYMLDSAILYQHSLYEELGMSKKEENLKIYIEKGSFKVTLCNNATLYEVKVDDNLNIRYFHIYKRIDDSNLHISMENKDQKYNITVYLGNEEYHFDSEGRMMDKIKWNPFSKERKRLLEAISEYDVMSAFTMRLDHTKLIQAIASEIKKTYLPGFEYYTLRKRI